MKPFSSSFTRVDTFLNVNRRPDFGNLVAVLERKKPSRPTLFEYFMCEGIYTALTRHLEYDRRDSLHACKMRVDAFRIAGYDYATVNGSDFSFPSHRQAREGSASLSLNEGSMITDRESFERYEWPDPEKFDYTRLESLKSHLPEGMKLMVTDNDGVLESVVKLVGYDNLCFLLIEDPELVGNIFNEVGSRTVHYHEICAGFDTVGGHIFGDDWGFNTQTMFSPTDLKKYLFPWHKRLVETVHSHGKMAVLHSCGNLREVFADITDDMKYDGKHSYEDNILRVEDAYEQHGSRIAILGGIDLDFLCRSTPKDIYRRACAMLEESSIDGGYALGSGNSIPDYVPQENYFAMIAAAVMNE